MKAMFILLIFLGNVLQMSSNIGHGSIVIADQLGSSFPSPHSDRFHAVAVHVYVSDIRDNIIELFATKTLEKLNVVSIRLCLSITLLYWVVSSATTQ